jgi:prepilin-type N-terminal cleavage/methylation domain-containing protein
MTTHTPRRGYTLFELLVVMAILLLLAVIIIPSVVSFRGDTRQRAAADVIRGELAVARARAKEEGRPYRVAVSDDGTRIRRAPDDTSFAEAGASSQASGSAIVVEYAFDYVTAQVVPEQDANPPTKENGWTTVAVVQPDGTCREDNVLVSLKDNDGGTLYLRVRGLTGRSRVLTQPPTNGGTK